MSKNTIVDPKYYLVTADSIFQLLNKINNMNERSINTHRRTTAIKQVVEPILSPGEYFAICYDVKLPPLQTVVGDDEPGS